MNQTPQERELHRLSDANITLIAKVEGQAETIRRQDAEIQRLKDAIAVFTRSAKP